MHEGKSAMNCYVKIVYKNDKNYATQAAPPKVNFLFQKHSISLYFLVQLFTLYRSKISLTISKNELGAFKSLKIRWLHTGWNWYLLWRFSSKSSYISYHFSKKKMKIICKNGCYFSISFLISSPACVNTTTPTPLTLQHIFPQAKDDCLESSTPQGSKFKVTWQMIW